MSEHKNPTPPETVMLSRVVKKLRRRPPIALAHRWLYVPDVKRFVCTRCAATKPYETGKVPPCRGPR